MMFSLLKLGGSYIPQKDHVRVECVLLAFAGVGAAMTVAKQGASVSTFVNISFHNLHSRAMLLGAHVG